MKYSNQRIKALGALSILFVLFFVLQALLQYRTYQFQLERAVQEKHQVMHTIAMNALKHPMAHRIDTFLQTNKDVIQQALTEHNRTVLLENPRIKQYWNHLREEYPNFSIMHFHDVQGRSFVRMHAPEHFGDDLSTIRLMINQVRQTQQKTIAYEAGRYGLSFRVASPIIDKHGTLLGVLELGLSHRWIYEKLRSVLPEAHPVIFIRQELCGIMRSSSHLEPASSPSVLGEYCLCGTLNDSFARHMPVRLPLEKGLHELSAEGRYYAFETENAIALQDFQGRVVAKIVMFYNTTRLAEGFYWVVAENLLLSLLLLFSTLMFGYWILTRLFRRIQAGERRYRELIENLPAGVAVHREGRIIFANATFAAMVHGGQKEVVGRKVLDFVVPESRQLVSNRLRASYHKTASPTVEYQVQRLDGSLFWAQVTAVPIELEGKEAVLPIVFDVTKRREMEDRLEELNHSLEQRITEEVEKNRQQERLLMQQSRMAAMGEMIGAIAHQWRQPLASLGGVLINIQDAFEFKELDPSLLESRIAEAEELLQYMSGTIDDFRNFFRPDKEKIAFDVYDATYEAVHLAYSQLKNHSIRMEFEVCYPNGSCFEFGVDQKPKFESSLYVLGFPSEFKQVILNLVHNAKDAILDRAVQQGIIHLKIEPSESQIILQVADNAGGIPEEFTERIFDPYFTTKEEGRGTGIGLYMAKMIIETNMKGALSFRNRSDGAEFTITLERYCE